MSLNSHSNVAPCHHGIEKVANYARLKQVGKSKWRVQCDYEDCPRSAHPTSGKTPEIALKKWNDREIKHGILKPTNMERK